MTGFLDALSCGFKQFARNIAGIASAACGSIFCDLSDKSVCIGELLSKYRVQKFDHEGYRCPIVVMKNDFAVACLDLPIAHWNSPPDQIDVEEPRTNREQCHYPCVRKGQVDTSVIFARCLKKQSALARTRITWRFQ